MTREQLNDPIWRLCNLYYVVNKQGECVLFKPNQAQQRLLDSLSHNNIILKARQLGFSTLIQLILLDQCVFNENTQATVIAQDEFAAAKIFADKIKYAWDNLPDWVHVNIKALGDSTRELALSNGSRITVASSARSGTPQYLHISEFGKICARFPGRAKEIITGSLNAVPDTGFTFIESTAEGREGYFHDMCMAALEREKTGKRKLNDFRLHFFAWFDDDGYQTEDEEELTREDEEYFANLEATLDIKISSQQRWWYVRQRREKCLGDNHKMRQEYPSTPLEAFETSVEGSWFRYQFDIIKRENRVTNVPHVKGHYVHTCWDIGRSDGTAIWCFQHINLDYRFIRFIEDWDKEYDHYVAELTRHGYVFGQHLLPHDADHRRQAKNKEQSKTAKQILEELGLRNVIVVPRTPQKIISINAARAMLPQSYFDQTNCKAGIAHLEQYTKHWDTASACFTDTPEHDIHSEASDAYQQFAIGYKQQTHIDIEQLNNAAANFRNNSNSFSPFTR